jgi:tripartite-type tricarboxylate transporter receptor subunit TctC
MFTATHTHKEIPVKNSSILATALFVFAASAGAQHFPDKPVRLVVPVAPGGANDILARTIGPRLSEAWGQQVLVENRAGGGGTIGAAFVARAKPDGYTLTVSSISHVVLAPTIFPEKPYDPIRDFTAITQLVNQPIVFAAHPSFPGKTVKDVIAIAKRNPGALAYGSPGIGSAMHLAGELLENRTGLDLIHVPYKGGGPAVVDLVSGQVPLLFVGLAPALPHIRSGRIRAIAVAGVKRSSVLAETPTIGESLPGYQVNFWVGVLSPAKTPSTLVTQINREIVKILGTPEVTRQLQDASFEVVGGTPEQFAAAIAEDLRRWTPVIKVAGIKPE